MEKSAVHVPLVAGDQARGLISSVDMEREHAFSDSDVRLLQTLANSMSVALENARLFDETQRRTRETAALAEVGRDISSTLDLATVMDRIARHAKDLLNADNSAIFLPDAGGQSLPGDRRGRRRRAGASSPTVIEVGEGIIGSLVQSGRAEFINDTGADPRGVQIAGTERRRERAIDGGAADRRQGREGRDGGVAHRRASRSATASWNSWSGCRCRRPSRSRTRACSPSRSSARPELATDQHGVAAARGQARPCQPARAGRRADPHGVQGRHRLRRAARPGKPASSTFPTSTATSSRRSSTARA